MLTWTSDELNKIGTAKEIEIAALKHDGTLKSPVTIWVVRVADDLYVRSWRGRNADWFRAAQMHHAGRIWVGGIEKDVSFVAQPDADLNNQIDQAYRAKYSQSPYVDSMIDSDSRTTTIKLSPRS